MTYLRQRRPKTTQQLRKAIIGDSLERKKALEKLLKIVREEERAALTPGDTDDS